MFSELIFKQDIFRIFVQIINLEMCNTLLPNLDNLPKIEHPVYLRLRTQQEERTNANLQSTGT